MRTANLLRSMSVRMLTPIAFGALIGLIEGPLGRHRRRMQQERRDGRSRLRKMWRRFFSVPVRPAIARIDRADVAADLRGRASMGAVDSDPGREARDAALVHRQERRHSALQGRSVAERSRDRHDREVGRRRLAAGQSSRHAAAADFQRQPLRMDVERSARTRSGSHRANSRAVPGERRTAPTGGSTW